VTREPSERWVPQQLRNATPFGKGPKFIIRDRDSMYGVDFDRVARGAGIRVLKTAVRAPLMNAICERFLGSVRRECLDHIVILEERHPHIVLGEYVAYFNGSRPHQGLHQRVPVPEFVDGSVATGKVMALPVLGGLHHEYRRAA
jgi:putative transposase